MPLKRTITLLIIISLIIYVLFSTNAINNRWGCCFTHVLSKKMLLWEINGTHKMFNPSITKYGENYVMCTRYSNKTVKNIFLYMFSELQYQSYICIVLLSPTMKIKKVVFPQLNDVPLEDPRIHYHNNKFYVSITEFNSKKDIFPTLYILNTNFDLIKRVEYNRSDYFAHTKPSNIQKNWCPFSHNKKLFLHTDTYPIWRVFEISDMGRMTKVFEIDTTLFFQSSKQKIIRCSTSWKSFTKNTYICGLHTKQFCGIFPTIRTILVEIDKKTLKPLRKTPVFCVDINNDTRIQFLSGLETDDSNVYLSYGIGDYKSEIKRFTKQHILNLFERKST
jgi:hypothetical protein